MEVSHPRGGINIHFWSNYMTFGARSTLGAKLPRWEEGWAGIQRGFTPAGIWGTGEGWVRVKLRIIPFYNVKTRRG